MPHSVAANAAKSAFLPEFVNRIDEVVTFDALTGDDITQIARLIVDRVADRLQTERNVTLTADDELIAQLAADGFDEEFGARPLQRHVRRTLERELTRAILSGSLTDGAHVRATAGDDGDVALEVNGAVAPMHEAAAA